MVEDHSGAAGEEHPGGRELGNSAFQFGELDLDPAHLVVEPAHWSLPADPVLQPADPVVQATDQGFDAAEGASHLPRVGFGRVGGLFRHGAIILNAAGARKLALARRPARGITSLSLTTAFACRLERFGRPAGWLRRSHRIARAGCHPVRRPVHAARLAWISPCSTSASAICTAFSAAPLRRLSETHQKARPFGTVGSRRRRETKTASSPAASAGVT